MSKQLHPLFSPKHQAYIARTRKATINVAEGAVRAGKTIDNVAAFAYQLEMGTPDRIHLATGSTVANAKLNIGDCNGFGLEYIFRGRCHWTKFKSNEALIIRCGRRSYVVIFTGAAKADSFKKIRGNSYGMWIATEINLHHENTVHEAFNRQLAARNRKIFWDLNPTAPGDPVYTGYIDRFSEQYGDRYNYEHFTIRDNLSISAERLADIEAQYDPKSVWYRRDILGERCAAEGLIYPMFDETCIVDEVPERGEYYISVDFGSHNPFSAGLWCWDGQAATRIREYYYSGRDERRELTVSQYYAQLERLAGDLPVKAVVVDPSATPMITEIRQHRRFAARKANNDVVPGITTVSEYLHTGAIKIHRSCVDTIREFGLYRWDPDATKDQPVKENDHAMDDIRYFCHTILRRKVGREAYVPIYMRG